MFSTAQMALLAALCPAILRRGSICMPSWQRGPFGSPNFYPFLVKSGLHALYLSAQAQCILKPLLVVFFQVFALLTTLKTSNLILILSAIVT